MEIFVLNGKFAIKCSYMENHAVQQLPKREFKKKFGLWAVAPIYDNAVVLMGSFTSHMNQEAMALAQRIIASITPATIEGTPPDVVIQDLLPHQQEAIRQAWNNEGYAILHRPRLRKTSTTIRLASGRFLAGQIDALLVVCPNSIKSVWASEFEKRAKCPYDLHVLDTNKNKKNIKNWMDNVKKGAGKLKVLVVSVEGQATEGSRGIATEFIEAFGKRAMMAVDESTRIKNHQSKRTEAIWDMGATAGFRNILTGSEITRSPSDLFAQFRFLGVHTLGFDSFYAFRNRYVLMGGFEGRKEIGCKNVEELMAKITQYAHLVKTSDVVDLPEKTFTQRVVEASKEQRDMIKELQKTMVTSLEGDALEVNTAMTMLLRAQQICGGFFPLVELDSKGDPVTTMLPLKKNPKLDELMEILSETSGKVVIWARFVAEIHAITEAIASKYGSDAVVQFFGQQTTDERTDARVKFQNNDDVKYFVGNPVCGSMGLELSAANTMVYYSMDYQYESRVQSLERATNIEKGVGVGIIDLTLDVRPDEMIMEATAQKKDISEWVEEAIHSGKFSLLD